MRIFSKLIAIACMVGSLVAGDKPVVYILATGGTIAGASSSSTASHYDAGKVLIETILQALPKEDVAKYATLKSEQILQKGSQNLTPNDWIIISKRVNEILKDKSVDGVVITHGTDTIEESAMFLQLTTKSDKPVVLVGAMRPSTSLSADGPKNLFDAIVLASSPLAKNRGVMLTFNGNIFSASDVTKSNPIHVDAFKAVNIGILGYMWNNTPYFLRESLQKHTTQSQFEISKISSLPQVEILYGYAGSSAKAIEDAVKNGAKGIVYAGVGNGNFNDEVEQALIKASKSGVKVVRTSRIIYGATPQWGEVDDEKYGFIASWWHTPQASRIILMLALNAGITDTKEIQKMMLEY